MPGLSQGELIDQNYALSLDGGCSADSTDGGSGCAVPELEFVLPVDSNDASNALNHRSFDNSVVDLRLAIDNSNNAGVSGDGGANNYADPTTGNPADVRTGIEFSIPLSQIGNPAALADVKVLAFVNGSGYDFSANQYSGTGVLQGNLGGDGSGTFTGDFSGVDLSAIAGDQFVTLAVPALSAVGAVPEPTTAVMLLLGSLGLMLRRRS